MKYIVITNNELVYDYYTKEYKHKNLSDVIKLEGNFLDVLIYVRDKVHEGHELLTHPLTGSVKPYETPYKSLLISEKKGNMDFNSLKIIEESIEVTKKFLNDYRPRNLKEKHLNDFKIIDKSLIDSGIESVNQIYYN